MHDRQIWIARWHEQGALSAPEVPQALRLAGIPPSRQEWRLWIERLLLWLGVAALLSGLIFFVAANWSGMGRFAKFALAETAIVASLAAYALGARFRHGDAALLAASLAVGALLALIGQTYQTGADTFELFLVWALLIVPWVLVARLPALWVLWLAILHVAYAFYVETFGLLWGFFLRDESALFVVVAFDFLALIVWEYCAAHGREWMRGRWVPRLLVLTGGSAATALAMHAILDHGHGRGAYFILYVIVLAGLYAGYRRLVPDLFMLAGGALSAIVVSTTWLGRILLENNRGDATGSILLLAIFSMLATAASAWWLRQIAQEQKALARSAGGNDGEQP